MKLVQYTKSYSFRVSRTINAPLRYVFDWCTDFQNSDPTITGSKAKRKILFRTERLVVYTSTYPSGGRLMVGVDVVTLLPPKAWHLDFLGPEDDETGDYTLSSLGPKRTSLDMTFTEHYKTDDWPSKDESTVQVSKVWDKYIEALEKDYASGKS